MDPNATLLELLESLQNQDGEGAAEACRNLADWLECGGFLTAPIKVSYTETSHGSFDVYHIPRS